MMTIPYSTVSTVVDSWDTVKRDPLWVENFGSVLFEKLFAVAPFSLVLLFPFGAEGEKMKESPLYSQTAQETVKMLDFMVASLGTDNDLIHFQINDIISEHKSVRRIRPEHWTVLSRALASALQATLGDKFDRQCRESWDYAFDSISEMMMETMKR